MSCKTLNIDMMPLVSYQISIVEEDGTETPITYKEYEIEILPIIEHRVQIKEIEKLISYNVNPNFMIDEKPEMTYGFMYCVAYRHPSLPEWILARGFWNDEGIWTPDGLWFDD